MFPEGRLPAGAAGFQAVEMAGEESGRCVDVMRQYGRRKAGALAPEVPSSVFRVSNISEEVQFLKGFSGTFRNGAERVFRNVDGQAGLLMKELVQSAQQGASAG